jgi:hypothetical protein
LAATAALIPSTAFAAGPAAVSASAKRLSAVVDAPAASAGAHLKSFSSPASSSMRLQKPAIAGARAAAAHGSTTAKATGAAAAGSTIYVAAYSYATCTNGTGAGTETDPYCSIQDAVNAAVSGDTVDVLGSQGYFSTEAVTISTSGISIVGVGNQAWDMAPSGSPAFVLNGVSDVTISNLMLSGAGNGTPTLEVLGSNHVTLDSDYIQGAWSGPTTAAMADTAIEIDGASSDVTVSRTYVNTGVSAPSDSGIAIEAGASAVTLAGDILASSGISATGVDGLDVTGDTIQRGCDAAIDVEGDSTDVYLENNLIEDANSATDSYLGGYLSQCQSDKAAWAPDVTVAAGSAPGTTANYNDFYVATADGTAPYSWAGTTYPSLSAFQAAVPQGAQDLMDPVQAGSAGFRPNAVADVDAYLRQGSTAIDSANPAAPGKLTTDYYGDGGYTSRGAIQYNSQNPTLAVSLNVEDWSARTIQFTADVTSAAGYNLEPTVDWGDGNSQFESFYNNSLQLSYTYMKLGTYTVSITVTDGAGDAVTNSVVITTAGTTYTALGPTRILDTRNGTGTGGAIAPVPAGGTLKLKVDGADGISAAAWAVAINLTATDPKDPGFLTAYPDGTAVPTASNVNFGARQTVANMAVVATGADGYIDINNHSTGSVDLVADVSGYYLPNSTGSGYTSVTPERFLDTRNGVGGYPAKTVSQGHPVTLQVDNRYKIPASGVSAVAVNITEANPSGSGFVTAWPGGAAQPSSSNLNFGPGQTLANSAIVPVGKSGTIELAYTGTGSARLIVDVEGYYSSTGSAYVPFYPFRLFDSRTIKNGALPSGYYYEIETASYGQLTPDTISGMVANTTVTDPTAGGDLVIFPNENISSDQPVTVPSTSALNFTTSQTVPNLSFISPGYGGYEDFYNQSSGSLQLVIDVEGYFMTS